MILLLNKNMKNSIVPFLFLVLLLGGKLQAQQAKKPNIVWITSEDNSKHYMKLFDKHGVDTPNIEGLAEQGLLYTHAFSNTPVCSAARSTLISGCYGPRLASHYHRKIAKVPMPKGVKMYPAYLKEAGYYTVNNAKEDYNIIKQKNVWDVSSKKGTWRTRAKNQPFFYIHNIYNTHEGQLHDDLDTMKKEVVLTPENSFVFPNHPNTEIFKYTNAVYRKKIKAMDDEVGKVIAKLKEDDLLEDTFIFYYGDHGGVLPGSKGYLYETGLHVPLVVYIPKNYQHLVDFKRGTKVDGFVSFIDIGVTALKLAGIPTPKEIDGQPFLGQGIKAKEVNKREVTFSYADRFDEKYEMVRAVRKGNLKYIKNYQPYLMDGLMNTYRYRQLAYQEWKELYLQGKLNKVQSQFFEAKQPEALYDLSVDPYETTNLAQHPKYTKQVKELRKLLFKQIKSMPDLSFYPEFYLIEKAFENPELFGEKNKKNILKYAKIADLSIGKYEKIKKQLTKSLLSSDRWERYWALIVCSSFGSRAKDQLEIVKKIATSDSELINQVRAAEYMALLKVKNPKEVMLRALYASKSKAEALLILNSIAFVKDKRLGYRFPIEKSKVLPSFLGNRDINERLTYILK